MTRSVFKIVALATFIGAFVLLPSASQAGSQFEFGVVSMGGSANEAVCDTIMTCQNPDDMFGGAQQPAISFDVISDQVVHIEADVYNGLGCGDFLGTSAGDLSLPAGHDIVFLRFDPPLDPGTQLSIVWRVDACEATACSDYTIGFDPGICQ